MDKEAQRGPERPSVDRTSLSCAWLAGWLAGGLAGWLADPKGSWSPQAKKWTVLSANHIMGSRFFEGPHIPKKGLQNVPGRPKPKSAQFYQQLTYWEAAFLKGPKSRKKSSQRLLVAPSQKITSFISNSPMYVLGSQPASQPAKRITASFYPRSAFLGLST